MTSNAVHSLYGGKVARERKALSGNVGGQARVQEVRTPEWVLDAVRRAFGGQIAWDPCATSDPSHHFAEYNVTLPPHAQALVAELSACTDDDEKKRLTKALKPHYTKGVSELHDFTFLNPPYGHLESWMRYAASGHSQRVVQLIPVRPHRTWWVKYAAGWHCVWLAPLAFVDQVQAFPAPLCLLSRNCVIPDLGKRETGRIYMGGR